MSYQLWSEQEIERLRSLCARKAMTNAEIAVAMGRTERSVSRKMQKLGEARPRDGKPWAEEEVAILLKKRGVISNHGLAKLLHRSRESVVGKIARLGLPPLDGIRRTVLQSEGARDARQKQSRFRPSPRYAPVQPPAPPRRVASTDPAALIAEALVAAAKKAESRNVAMRTGRRL